MRGALAAGGSGTTICNVRATRATELTAQWLRHSTMIAQNYAWQVTDANFDLARQRATRRSAKIDATSAQRGIEMRRLLRRMSPQKPRNRVKH
jgi:hypothetical protein